MITRRRWFRLAFSLRTLFVVVTVFGCWLGWQIRIVQSRKAFLKSRVVWFGPSNATFFHELHIPFYRRWLGDEDVKRLDVLSADDLDAAGTLFPEATLIFYVPGPEFKLRDRSSGGKPSRESKALPRWWWVISELVVD